LRTLAEKLKRRRVFNRPVATIEVRIFEDLIDDLEEMAIALGYSGMQPLVRSYIGQGLREHESLQAAGLLDAERRRRLGEG
jgi:hypothetical protein